MMMRDPNIMVAVISGLLGGGFISFIQFLINRADQRERERDKMNPEKMEMLVKLSVAEAQDRIVWLGLKYIERGWITYREWAIYEQMYLAYKDLGGNHYAAAIFAEVSHLRRVVDRKIPPVKDEREGKNDN
jgi:hypothetical protein